MDFGFTGLLVALVIGLIWIWNSLYVIKEWERGVVLRLGRMIPEPKPAGVRLVFWPIETLYRVSLQIETLDVPAQDIITRDNVSVKVNAVCYFRVVDANLALSQMQKLSLRHFAEGPDDFAQHRGTVRTRRNSLGARKGKQQVAGDP